MGKNVGGWFVLYAQDKRLVKNMRKNIVRAAALLLLLALLPAMALASSRYAVVRGGRLNLRQYPSTTSYSLGKYKTGSWVVAGEESGGWCPVKTMDGKQGYMSARYLDFGIDGGGAKVKYANGGYVNMRSGPSMDASVIMRVTSGTTFYIQSSYNGWCYGYAYSNGSPVYGYMSGAFLDTGISTAVVTTRNGGRVNVRSGPSSKYAGVGSLPSGTRVSVLLKGNGWYMISANGVQGFMSTQYLSGTGDTIGDNTGSGTTTSMTAWVNNPKSTQVLNLRETPSQSARSLGQYRNGTRVKVVNKGATWCEVYVGTRHGYMMTRYLSFNGNYLPPTYPDEPTYPSYPSYPNYPSYTTLPIYPSVTPIPTWPPVESITPIPTQKPPTQPQAGDTITLATAAGDSSGTIAVFHDAALTQVRGTYSHGTKAMMLQYGPNSCMIYVDGGVGYVLTINVND